MMSMRGCLGAKRIDGLRVWGLFDWGGSFTKTFAPRCYEDGSIGYKLLRRMV